MPAVFIGMGSNLGDRQAALAEAAHLLEPEARIIKTSHIYETPPWGYADQPAFLNLVLEVETTLPAQALLEKLKAIEVKVGRQPNFRYGPRLIDLDILFYDDMVLESEALQIPHPKAAERAFVLAPMAEIAPDFKHPSLGKTIKELAEHCDKSGIKVFSGAPMPAFAWGKRTYIMGIINLTPDSFSGDGVLAGSGPLMSALEQAEAFIRAGADILDLGAESSRPGAQLVPAEEEISRLLPVIKAIKARGLYAALSVDTWKAEVAESCLQAGAGWINDIWGLRADPGLADVIAKYGAAAVLMHNRSRAGVVHHAGSVGSSYAAPDYTDFIPEVMAELEESFALALKAGIPAEKIILDPGIGFGKTLAQNLSLINDLGRFKELGCPLLIGPSRKSFIGQVLGLPVDEREEGTAAAVALGIAKGADIIRVHNVKMMARVARMADAIVRKQ